jgi:hypothetical protein
MPAPHVFSRRFAVLLVLFGCLSSAWPQPRVSERGLTGNGIAVTIRSSAHGFGGMQVRDLLDSRTIDVPEAFTIVLKDGTVLRSSEMRMQPRAQAELSATNRKGAAGSQSVCGLFTDSRISGDVRWCLTLRAHAHYFRQETTIAAQGRDLPVSEVRLLDFRDPEAHLSGSVRGSPIVDSGLFFGFEHPLSSSRISDGHVTAFLARELPLRAGQSVTYSAVIGVAPPGQMRRAFLAYLEAERPRPYQPFLHYNSWYDLGYENRYDEAGALDRIRAFGTELAVKRHVRLESFLFDDGWDNPNSLWSFDSGFPHGFTAASRAAGRYGAGIGVWLSPWGGYAQQKQERVAYGRQHGYEIINNGFALSGPRYYKLFEQICLEMIDRYDVNQFKFDGTGNASRVFPGSEFDSDFDAAIHLIETIRRHKPGVFINLTTGTYASPFWLFYADSIWRGGDDHSFAGVGTSRQRWITYRDQETYRNIVLQGPLFPLNSLMLHGLIYAQFAKGLSSDPGHDFASEVQSYFGGGTQLQEMYITPSLLSSADWDMLARAANWSFRSRSILKDTHWIGGDPGKLEVYGWAAWSPQGWIVTLRNPSDRAQDFSLDLRRALELPRGTAISGVARDPFNDSQESAMHLDARGSNSIHLAPFQVRTFEALSGTGAADRR